MTPYRKRQCPLTKRLAEDMQIRHLADATIDAYTYHVRKFADFTGKPLDQATVEDVRTFQLYLIQQKKVAYGTFNQAVCALRFLYTHTIRVPWPVTMVPFGKRPKTLPTVLSRQEVDRLIECTPNLKHRTFLMTLYSAGLRFAEAAALRIHDIDSARMLIRVACGKGKKERLVPLSPRLLKELRIYWKKYKPTGLLFPGKTPEKPYADTTIRMAMKDAAERAQRALACARLGARRRTGAGRSKLDGGYATAGGKRAKKVSGRRNQFTNVVSEVRDRETSAFTA